MKKSITPFAKEKIKLIHSLSQGLNKLREKEHAQVLLELINSHAKEITDLYKQKDKHYIIETGDLLILCFELLQESGQDFDQIIQRCYQRYINKISDLTQEFNKQGDKSSEQ